jgi:hypothetical protein
MKKMLTWKQLAVLINELPDSEIYKVAVVKNDEDWEYYPVKDFDDGKYGFGPIIICN